MPMAQVLPTVLMLPLQVLRMMKAGSLSITAVLIVVIGILQVVIALLVLAAAVAPVEIPAPVLP